MDQIDDLKLETYNDLLFVEKQGDQDGVLPLQAKDHSNSKLLE